MTLPTREDIDHILSERPGDDLYPAIKDKVDQVDKQEEAIKTKIVGLILKDLLLDLAIANGLDETGKILEYFSQKRGIEPPEFSGELLMRNFSRISKLRTSIEYAELIGLEGPALDLMLKAEVDRLWGDSNSALLKKILVNKAAAPSVQNVAPVVTGVKQNASE